MKELSLLHPILPPMIATNRSKNKDWSIGATVNVGFMRDLKVIDIHPIYDGLPDIYILESPKGKRYEFIPHNGLLAI